MRRFFISTVLLLVCVALLFAGWLYLFDINDYSQWISKQIKESTGYQVNFSSIESAGGWHPHFLVNDLSVVSDKNAVLHINKMHIDISKWDLWQRQLELGLVELVGVDLHVRGSSLDKVASIPKAALNSDKIAPQQPRVLPWSKLQINKLRISDLNADIANAEQGLRLQQANLASDNLPVIEHNKLANLLLQGNLQFDFKKLNLQSADSQAMRIEDFSLRSDFNLLTLQAKSAAAIKRFTVGLPEQAEIIVENSLLDLQMDKNKLSLTRLSADTFSGKLQLQAEALLSVELLPAVRFSVKQVTVQSLLMEDMQLKIPAFLQPVNKEQANSQLQQKLPLQTLFLQQINLQNLTVSSAEKRLPLTIRGLNGQLQGFYLVQNNQLFDLSAGHKQAGLFTLQFAYLQWAETVIEQFAAAGSFSEDARQLLLLQQLLTDQ